MILEKLISWTTLDDGKAEYFSGTGVYEHSFTLDGELADEYILSLGEVAESARVWVNDQEVDVLWGIPFKIRIGKYLNAGENNEGNEVSKYIAWMDGISNAAS